jgi:hypothetical protein
VLAQEPRAEGERRQRRQGEGPGDAGEGRPRPQGERGQAEPAQAEDEEEDGFLHARAPAAQRDSEELPPARQGEVEDEQDEDADVQSPALQQGRRGQRREGERPEPGEEDETSPHQRAPGEGSRHERPGGGGVQTELGELGDEGGEGPQLPERPEARQAAEAPGDEHGRREGEEAREDLGQELDRAAPGGVGSLVPGDGRGLAVHAAHDTLGGS